MVLQVREKTSAVRYGVSLVALMMAVMMMVVQPVKGEDSMNPLVTKNFWE